MVSVEPGVKVNAAYYRESILAGISVLKFLETVLKSLVKFVSCKAVSENFLNHLVLQLQLFSCCYFSYSYRSQFYKVRP